MRMLRRPAGPQGKVEHRRIAWQSASLLLGYPDPGLPDRLDLVDRTSYALPPRLGEPLRTSVTALAQVALPALEADYVETFDTCRRHTLFLTYFAHGDTRKRGMALLRFSQAYRRAGFVLDGGELPDHLCVVLEFAATVDADAGHRLLCDHRAGLELLRMSLVKAGSRWAGAAEAVCACLPELRGDEVEAVRKLAAQGPPAEEVGLTPYGTPGFDPGPAAPPAPRGAVDLPVPTFRRA